MKSIHPNSVAAYWAGRLELFGKRHQKVVAALRAARSPLTDREVMIACGFADPNAVRPRITELVGAEARGDKSLVFEAGLPVERGEGTLRWDFLKTLENALWPLIEVRGDTNSP